MFHHGLQPQTAEQWFNLAKRQIQTAKILLDAKRTLDSWAHAGFAVECALKAAYMQRTRPNRWPSQSERPDLYTHKLSVLMELAEIDQAALRRDPAGPAFMTALLWQRTESYNPKAMPMRMAADMYEAVNGANGVLQWIATNYRLTI